MRSSTTGITRFSRRFNGAGPGSRRPRTERKWIRSGAHPGKILSAPKGLSGERRSSSAYWLGMSNEFALNREGKSHAFKGRCSGQSLECARSSLRIREIFPSSAEGGSEDPLRRRDVLPGAPRIVCPSGSSMPTISSPPSTRKQRPPEQSPHRQRHCLPFLARAPKPLKPGPGLHRYSEPPEV
jgi:hypothetical protein